MTAGRLPVSNNISAAPGGTKHLSNRVYIEGEIHSGLATNGFGVELKTYLLEMVVVRVGGGL
jgi:hypothetical protein